MARQVKRGKIYEPIGSDVRQIGGGGLKGHEYRDAWAASFQNGEVLDSTKCARYKAPLWLNKMQTVHGPHSCISMSVFIAEVHSEGSCLKDGHSHQAFSSALNVASKDL